jgi:hypothetical protein
MFKRPINKIEMTRQNQFRALILSICAVVLIAVLISNRQPDNRLVNTFESVNAFSFKYPDGWQYVIPQYNVLLLGKPQTVIDQQPGPTLTVHRSLTLIAEGSLENALDTYLLQGPLSPDKAWKKLTDMIPITLSDLPAIVIDLQGSERPTWPELHTQITAVRARNGNIYFLSLSSPTGDWESDRPVLEAILNSIKIVE